MSAGCASAGAAANSISAMIAMRDMRDNEKAAVILHASIPARANPAKLAAPGPLATVRGKAAPASPPPFTGEGQGGGMQKGSRVRATPSPTLPRKRGREHTECGEGAH